MVRHLDWVAIGEIIVIDILLGGDNALIIALACRNLPAEAAAPWHPVGRGGRDLLRVILITVAVALLDVPVLKLIGGLMLLMDRHQTDRSCWEDGGAIATDPASDKLRAAIKTIIVADFVMSLDNVIAIAGAAEQADPSQRTGLIIFGLLVSVPFIVFGSQLILKLLDRFPVIVLLGGALLGWIAGGLIDRLTPCSKADFRTTTAMRYIVSRHHRFCRRHRRENLQARRTRLFTPMNVALDFALKTHPGLVRPLNEDAIGADPSCGLFALGRRLGGYNAGEVASVMAISSVLERLSRALGRLALRTRSTSRRTRPSTTRSTRSTPASTTRRSTVRRSRAWRRRWSSPGSSATGCGWRTPAIEAVPLSRRSARATDARPLVSQELLDAGMVTEEEARILPAKNLVTRALGASPRSRPKCRTSTCRPGT